MTQAAPTNFHVFVKQKVLLDGESADQWREVTDKEKQTLEASDAAFVRPPQSFIDRVNAACGENGGYNEQTGYCELNGLKDITCAEMIQILDDAKIDYGFPNACSEKVRTNLLNCRTENRWAASHPTVNMQCLFSYCMIIETARIARDGKDVNASSIWALFRECRKLRKVYGILAVGMLTSTSNLDFQECYLLEDINIKNLKLSLNLKDCKSLSLDSIAYMITNAINTSAITVTVHADVLAKLNDAEGYPEWYAVAQQAAEKQIAFASA